MITILCLISALTGLGTLAGKRRSGESRQVGGDFPGKRQRRFLRRISKAR